jgi:translation elongation factor EF-Ts
MNAGRIETYLHSDGSTQNKGGCMVEVLCQTDFGAKSDEFINFCKLVAKMAYAFQVDTLDGFAGTPVEDAIKATLESLKKSVKETITVRRIVRWSLTDEPGNV